MAQVGELRLPGTAQTTLLKCDVPLFMYVIRETITFDSVSSASRIEGKIMYNHKQNKNYVATTTTTATITRKIMNRRRVFVGNISQIGFGAQFFRCLDDNNHSIRNRIASNEENRQYTKKKQA